MAMIHDRSVTEMIRQDILKSFFPPGFRLVESVLCERYMVSRAAVRGALLELSGEGLVDREVQRGAVVRRIDTAEAIQITEARAVLESLIASNAARNASAAERDELLDIGKRMREAVNSDKFVEYSDLNKLLHRRVGEISKHIVAAELVATLRNRSAHHQFRLAMVPGRPGDSLAQHEAIIRAIVVGDGDGATEAMAAHLQSVAELLARWKEVNMS